MTRITIGTPRDCEGCGRELVRGEGAHVAIGQVVAGAWRERRYLCDACHERRGPLLEPALSVATERGAA